MDGAASGPNTPSTASFLAADNYLEMMMDEKSRKNTKIRLLSIGTGKVNRPLGKETRDFGGVEWIQNGLISILCQDTRSEQEAKERFRRNPQDYLRVNCRIEENRFEMDNCKEENLQALRQIGKQMWEDSKVEILKFFGY